MKLREIETGLRESANKRKLSYTKHAIEQMVGREISPQEVLEVLRNGEIIEFYEKDLPFPLAA